MIGDEYTLTDWWNEPITMLGTACTISPAIYDPPASLRQFPPGFHGAAPGPSRPEPQIVRVKAVYRKLP